MSDDIVIIGGGLAGLTTANRAAELGLNPILLEQGSDPQYFCNSRFAGGILHVAFKDLTASPDEIAAAVRAQTGEGEATALGPVMAEECGRALTWLRGEGAKFIKGGSLEFMRWILAPPRPRGAGLDWKGRGPDVLLRKLTANLSERGKAVRLNARARELVLEGGRVTGVVVESGGTMETIPAAAVVISDGGFQANMDLMRRYVSPAPEKLLQRGAATGHGDGMTMAEAAGAKLVGMDRFYGHLLGRDAFEIEKLWPYPIVDPIAAHSIVVDEAGQRFLDEGMGGVYMANEVAKLDDPLTATVVFDDAVWNGLAADNRYPPCMNPVFVNAGGTVLEAPDLATLAQKAGVSADGLSATVAAYNSAIESGAAQTPARTVSKFTPQPIATPPFRAIPICAGITYTMGGIAIDRDSRVQAQAGGAIPGLFAAGSASGGMEGGPTAAYLGGLTKAVITGLRAAEAAAGAAQAAA
ncbi:MAG: FAD-dependent oxidoreductase [Rhodospirillaceae bacterium]|nr:FAD-dependent oxidoreductase [Rhodospirillaceae bacterium]MDD9929436.1 FAD-dependent oxidoreductase [Rhodospirillaceae bacterium]